MRRSIPVVTIELLPSIYLSLANKCSRRGGVDAQGAHRMPQGNGARLRGRGSGRPSLDGGSATVPQWRYFPLGLAGTEGL